MINRISLTTAQAVLDEVIAKLPLGSSNRDELKTSDDIGYRIKLARLYVKDHCEQLPFLGSLDPYHPLLIELHATYALANQCGNCGEMAAVAFQLLLAHAGNKEIFQVSAEDCAHEFLVCNRDVSTDAAVPSSWNEGVTILDIWAGVCEEIKTPALLTKNKFAIQGGFSVTEENLELRSVTQHVGVLTEIECKQRVQLLTAVKPHVLNSIDTELKEIAEDTDWDVSVEVEHAKYEKAIDVRIAVLSSVLSAMESRKMAAFDVVEFKRGALNVIPFPIAEEVYNKTVAYVTFGSDNQLNNPQRAEAYRRIAFARNMERVVENMQCIASSELIREIYATFAIGLQGGNCGEMASISFQLLNSYPGNREIVVVKDKGDKTEYFSHTLILVNRDWETTNIDDPSTWNPETMIIDPWGKVCQFSRDGFTSKLDFAKLAAMDVKNEDEVSLISETKRSDSLTVDEYQLRLNMWRSIQWQLTTLGSRYMKDLLKNASKRHREKFPECTPEESPLFKPVDSGYISQIIHHSIDDRIRSLEKDLAQRHSESPVSRSSFAENEVKLKRQDVSLESAREILKWINKEIYLSALNEEKSASNHLAHSILWLKRRLISVLQSEVPAASGSLMLELRAILALAYHCGNSTEKVRVGLHKRLFYPGGKEIVVVSNEKDERHLLLLLNRNFAIENFIQDRGAIVVDPCYKICYEVPDNAALISAGFMAEQSRFKDKANITFSHAYRYSDVVSPIEAEEKITFWQKLIKPNLRKCLVKAAVDLNRYHQKHSWESWLMDVDKEKQRIEFSIDEEVNTLKCWAGLFKPTRPLNAKSQEMKLVARSRL